MIRAQKPEAVVFDLGKVLLDFDYGRLANNMLNSCGVPFEKLMAIVNQSELLFRYETGLMTSHEFFEEVKNASNFTGKFHDFERMFADIFSPIPKMVELQQRLQSQNIPTYIFSNTNEIAVKHIQREYPFFAHFDGYIFSFEHGSMKPDARIYEVVEETSSRAGPELLYIDDRAENIDRGRERGWQTIHHKNVMETIKQVERLLALGVLSK